MLDKCNALCGNYDGTEVEKSGAQAQYAAWFN
jgi:hypothetical protein